jgi:hypothetical protein
LDAGATTMERKEGFFLLKGGIRGISPGLGQHRNVCICIATIHLIFAK